MVEPHLGYVERVACTFDAALFDRSPEGLPIDSVTDIRFLDKDNRDKDRDGKPITRTFPPKERLALQRIAWEGYRKFKEICDAEAGE